jgi:hypothetical protein
MKNYRVLFYKELLNSDGHSFKCLQQQIDVHSDGPSGALVLAEASIDNARLDADCVEVVHLADGRNHLEHLTEHSPAPCKHAWNRGPKP